MVFSNSESKKDPKILEEISKAEKNISNAGQCNQRLGVVGKPFILDNLSRDLTTVI